MTSDVSVDATEESAPPRSGASPLRLHKGAVVLGLLALFIVRLWYLHVRQLVPDEAVYWQWSRHLQLGYLDHPPMVAAIIKASTAIFGTSEFAVRLPMALLAWGAIAVIVALAHALYRDTRITVLAAVIWLTSPLWSALLTLATPDTPAFFFSTGALACGLMAVNRQEQGRTWRSVAAWWLASGICVGLGLVSKYTVVLLPASVGLALLTSTRGRRVLLSPWPWVAGALAVTLFMPVVWWNYRNGWVSFAYQLHHGTDATVKAPLAEFGGFVGGQMLVWTPVLFVIAMIVLWTWWGRITGLWARSGNSANSPAPSVPLFEQILAWSGTLPLVFFGYSATRSHTEMNWPGFAYVPISLLTVKFVAEKWPERIGWAKTGCIVALVFTVVLHLPELILMTGAAPPAVVNQFESRPFAKLVEQNTAGLPVVCNRHQDAGMASFYMTGRPDIWAVNSGSRPTAFDYMKGGPDLHAMPAVTFVGWHVKEFCEQYGFPMTPGLKLEIPSVRKKERFILITHFHRSVRSPTTMSQHPENDNMMRFTAKGRE